MTEGLTQKQADVYNAIVKYKIENGYSPTIYEIGEILNKSVGAIQFSLNILERKGYITFEKYKNRTIKVVK